MTTLPGRVDSALIRAAFAKAPIGVTITRDGVTEHCNAAYLEMFGYQGHEQEIYGSSLLTMVAPEARAVILERIQRRQLGDPIETAYDSVGLRRDGSTFPFHVAVRRVELDDGPATLAFFFDISERLRAEEALRNTNEKLDALIRCCPVPIVLMDEVGTVQVWNPAAEQTFGWTEQEAVGRPIPIVSESSQSDFQRNLRAAMAGGIRAVEARRVRKDGSPIDISIWAAPVRSSQGEPVGVLALTADISERKRTEAALMRSQEQLRHAQKLEAVGRLAGGVAHDFNNLLTAISGFAELVRLQVGENEEATASALEIQRAVERAAALTRQLLAFSRQQELSPKVLDLNEIVTSMNRMLSRLVGPKVSLQSELAADLGRVRADTSQVEQVISNLVVNANDAMPAGGRLTLKTRNADLQQPSVRSRTTVPAGSYVVLEVSDTGTGMDDSVLSRLFEPFFTTKERGKGTGLGLSTVYGIVVQSGGCVDVDSRLGGGSTFRVYLPRVDEPVATSDTTARDASSQRSGTVLVVEDDPTLLELVATMLEQTGYQALRAEGAAAALARLSEPGRRVHLMLTDVLMPDVSGPELAEQAWRLRPELPVIFMSGYAEPATFPALVRERASGFVHKPFDWNALTQKVDEVLRETGARERAPAARSATR